MDAQPPTILPVHPSGGPLDALAGVVSLRNVRLLDVGCGRGRLLATAAAAGAEVWGVDESAGNLAASADLVPGADLRLGSADDLPFDNGMFDVVCSAGTLDRCALAAAIVEMARVCRPGGAVVVWPVTQSRDPDR